MIRGIHHVGVHVRDLDRMIRFYREAFGFELVGDEPGRGPAGRRRRRRGA